MNDDMPLIYRKILDYLQANEGRPRVDVEGDIVRSFRITKEELRQALNEMSIWGTTVEMKKYKIKVRE